MTSVLLEGFEEATPTIAYTLLESFESTPLVSTYTWSKSLPFGTSTCTVTRETINNTVGTYSWKVTGTASSSNVVGIGFSSNQNLSAYDSLYIDLNVTAIAGADYIAFLVSDGTNSAVIATTSTGAQTLPLTAANISGAGVNMAACKVYVYGVRTSGSGTITFYMDNLRGGVTTGSWPITGLHTNWTNTGISDVNRTTSHVTQGTYTWSAASSLSLVGVQGDPFDVSALMAAPTQFSVDVYITTIDAADCVTLYMGDGSSNIDYAQTTPGATGAVTINLPVVNMVDFSFVTIYVIASEPGLGGVTSAALFYMDNLLADDGGGGGSAIKTWDGLADASVKTVDGLARASVKTRNGLA